MTSQNRCYHHSYLIGEVTEAQNAKKKYILGNTINKTYSQKLYQVLVMLKLLFFPHSGKRLTELNAVFPASIYD